MLGLPLTCLKSYNAGYKHNMITFPYYIILPKSHVMQFKNLIATTKLIRI